MRATSIVNASTTVVGLKRSPAIKRHPAEEFRQAGKIGSKLAARDACGSEPLGQTLRSTQKNLREAVDHERNADPDPDQQ